jgi:GNAT superfamily N-acetyltransferase
MALQFPTRAERPGSQPHAAGLRAGLWPGFMYHDPVQNRYFRQVIEDYAEFHFYAWDDEREEVVGGGNAIPAAWDRNAASLPARGISAIVEAAFAAGAHAPNVLCALQIVIDPEYGGRGLSRRMIDRMREIGGEHGLDTLIAPVRPSLKHRYPLAPMGSLYHLAATGRHAPRPVAEDARAPRRRDREDRSGVAENPGTVAEWEEWTEMAFPESGAYVVPGALVPVEVDRERDEGLYVEPNVWMVHPAKR